MYHNQINNKMSETVDDDWPDAFDELWRDIQDELKFPDQYNDMVDNWIQEIATYSYLGE